MTVERCLDCDRVCRPKSRRRGLCDSCYRDPEVRDNYPHLPRGTWSLERIKPWSPVDIAQMVRLVTAGVADAEIANIVGRTRGAVRRKRNLMKLKRGVRLKGMSKPGWHSGKRVKA